MLRKVKSKELGVRSKKNFIFRLFSFFCLLCSVLYLLSSAHASTDNGLELSLAQADTSAPTDSTSSDTISPDSSADLALSGDTEDDDDTNSMLSQSTQSPLVSNSGVAKKNIPIIVPQGRKGIEPRISLNYNSNSQNGWLGIGWTLDIGAIQRETRWGLDYNSNQYNFVINNLLSRLVPRVGWGTNYYEAKIESEFTKYYYDTASNGWVATAKDGTKYYYGSTLASRQVDPADPTKIFKWCLDKVQDTNGNYMTITYWKDSANKEIYLEEIKYTGNSNTSHPPDDHKVRFIRDDGTRPDAPVMYTTHFTVKTIYRLKTIEVSSGGSPVRTYQLSYTPSGTISRSLLSGVQEFGNTGQTALPKMTNVYFIENDGSFNDLVNTSLPGLSSSYKVAFADVTGDKKADAILYRVGKTDGASYINVTISNDNGYFSNSFIGNNINQSFSTGWKFAFADVNGDGMADTIANYIGQSDGDAKLSVALSNGNGSFGTGTCGNIDFPPSQDVTSGYGTGWKFTFADVNGDGRTDAIAYRIGNAEGSAKLSVALASAIEEGKFGGFTDTTAATSGYGTGWKFTFADVNGDGMADAIANYIGQSDGARVKVALSKGDGKFEDNFQLTTLATSEYGSSWKFTFADINGDGMADAIAYKLKSNYGNFERQLNVALSKGGGTFKNFVSSNHDSNLYGHPCGYGFADIDGDGKTDAIPFCTAKEIASGWWDGTYFDVALAKGDTGFNLLQSNNNGLGGTTEIVYKPSSEYINSYLPFVQQTISQVTVKDGRGNESVTTFDYSGGYYSVAQKEFRGFEYVKSTAPNGTVTASWFKQDDVYRGFIETQTVEDSSNNIYTSIENTYNSTSPYTGVDYPYLSKIDDYIYDGNNNNEPRHIINQFTYDDYGNIESKYYAEVPLQGDEKTEYTGYNYDLTNWIVSLPYVKYVVKYEQNHSETIKARTWYTYDIKGNLLRKTDELDTGDDPVTTYDYDLYGNIVKITDPNQNLKPVNERASTVVTYDTLTHTFPAVITNPKGHIIQKTYDTVYVDRVKTETDPNLNTTTYEYDKFGRIKKITKPAPYGITEYSYPDLNTPENQFGTITQHVREEAQDGAGTLIHFKETYFDGLERTRTEKQGGPGATRTIIVDTGYNEKGLVDTKTYPYFDGDTAYEILYFYDPVDRLEYTYNPDNTSSSIAYDRGWITYIDANNHKKVQVKDIYNRNIAVEEYKGNFSSNYVLYATTTYWYDVLNNLETVVDASDNHNQTDITYDSLSRKIAMDDPDMGYWTYTYDANGNLKTQTDAKNKTITFTYDPLNRVTLKNYPTGTDTTYTYDEPSYTNSIGRLTTLADSSGTTKSYYDSMGQITKTIKTIGSDTYTTQTQYDPLGRVKKIIYPDTLATEVDYTYDGNGNIKDITSGATTYANYSNYTAVGDPLSVGYGNDKVNSTYQYLPQNNRLYQLITNSVTQGGLINISYNYDNVGNIRILSDSITPSRTRMYTYDDLDRLIDANSQMYEGYLLYQYDKIGNMTYNCRKGNYEYDSDHPHAVKRIVSNGATESYHYDANGNMDSRVGKTLTYDYDNRPTRINYGSTYVDSVYDALGSRVTKTVSGQVTKYIGQMYECTGGVCTKYIFAGTKRIAQVKGSNTYYYHTDHLESSTVITDQNGNKVEELLYYPFGEILSDSSPTKVRYKFNGHEFDSETQLIYMKARYYDPKLARFVSPDPVVPVRVDLYNFRDFKMTQFRTLTNPQALNRYSYVVNNPIVFRDPLGLWTYAREYGTTGTGLTKNMTNIEGNVDSVFQSIANQNAVVTYTTNGTHSPTSLHYGGNAVDLRTRDITADQSGKATNKLQDSLGSDYDVINEGDHIHIEYDPKPANPANAIQPQHAAPKESVNNNSGTEGSGGSGESTGTGKKSETEEVSPPNLNHGPAASVAAPAPAPANSSDSGSSGYTGGGGDMSHPTYVP